MSSSGTSKPCLIFGVLPNDLEGKSDDEIREVMGDKFPNYIYHSIACIGALIAHRDTNHHILLQLSG